MAGAFQPNSVQSNAFQADPAYSAADAVSTADVATRGAQLFRFANQSVTTSDAPVVSIPGPAFQFGAFQSNAFQMVPSHDYSASDAPATSDVATRRGLFRRTSAEHVFVTDSAAIGSGNRNAGDNPATSDSAARTGQFHRTATDAVATSDLATKPTGGQRFIVVIIG